MANNKEEAGKGTPRPGEMPGSKRTYATIDLTASEVEGQLLRGLYAVWTAMPEVGPLFYYTLDDFGGTDRENYFGLTRADGSLKPAFSELQNWIRHANATDSK